MQGDCKEAPPPLAMLALEGPPLLWAAPQCVLVFDHNILKVAHALWLDAVVLRARTSAWFLFFFLEFVDIAQLYITRVTFQGDDNIISTAVFAYGGDESSSPSKVFLQGMFHVVFISRARPRLPWSGSFYACDCICTNPQACLPGRRPIF